MSWSAAENRPPTVRNGTLQLPERGRSPLELEIEDDDVRRAPDPVPGHRPGSRADAPVYTDEIEVDAGSPSLRSLTVMWQLL